jgi:glycosyltransferase involved in cell wall biosynthesis
MKKIMFFIPYLVGGGAQRVVVNLLKGINKEKFKLLIVVVDKNGYFSKAIPKDVEVVELNSKRALTSIGCLRKTIKKYEPDVFLSNLDYANIVSTVACIFLKNKPKLILTEHLNYSRSIQNKNTFKKLIFSKLLKFSYKRADRIVTVSKGITNDLITYLNLESYRDKFITIYNPIVDDELLTKKNEEINDVWLNDEGLFNIIGVGRLSEQKDFKTLLKAFLIIKKQFNFVRLLLLGEGELREELENTIKELGIKESVRLVGFVDNPYAFMRKADVFVLSSKYEGFGNVIVEAMACATPVVSTNCPSGPSEIIKDDACGLLCEVENEQDLAEKIIKLLKNKEKRGILSENGLKRSGDFTIEKVAQIYEELFLYLYH